MLGSRLRFFVGRAVPAVQDRLTLSTPVGATFGGHSPPYPLKNRFAIQIYTHKLLLIHQFIDGGVIRLARAEQRNLVSFLNEPDVM